MPKCLIVLIALTATAAFAQVTITPADRDFVAKAPAYEATVGHDGCLTSIKSDGLEFFKSAAGFPRGAYLYQGGIHTLGAVTSAESSITAESEKASIVYEFTDEAIVAKLTNKTKQEMSLVIVFDLGVKAVIGDDGRYHKAPAQYPWPDTTWFNERSRLRIQGGSKIWGPWGEGHQVWQSFIKPGETIDVTFTPGVATDEEFARATEAANRKPYIPEEPDGPMWDLEKLSRVPQVWPAEGLEAEGVRGIFYEGEPYQGKPTRVFAWLGLPDVKPGEKVPAMVLVHGGGGTAFDDWVRMWTARGYAAISMDTCGCLPTGEHGNRPRHEHGGPPGWGGWGQQNWPREDQWPYHAIADILLANSLMRSLPEVDPERIGLTGISWGGYLTSMASGVDPRFRFVAPVYGCGYYLETAFGGSVTAMTDDATDRWNRWWDPSVYLKDSKMPMLWVNGTNDFAYWMPAWQKSYRTAKGPRTLALRPRMPHGQGQGAAPEEIHAFANHILKGGPPLPKITGQGRDGSSVWATFEPGAGVVKAELNYTLDVGTWPEREWKAEPAEIDDCRVTAELPEGTKLYFLNLVDEAGLVVSSEHEELPE